MQRSVSGWPYAEGENGNVVIISQSNKTFCIRMTGLQVGVGFSENDPFQSYAQKRLIIKARSVRLQIFVCTMIVLNNKK